MKSNLFKLINGILAVFCVGAMYANHVGVNILSAEKATSSIGNDNFEYQSGENSFSFTKNGKLVGYLPTERKINFKSYSSILTCNAVVIGVKSVASAGTAAAAGAVVGAAAPTAALSAVGFGSGGIIAGSIAAGAQAAIGNVAAGSMFAWLTSAGFAAVTAPVLTAGAVIGGVGVGLA